MNNSTYSQDEILKELASRELARRHLVDFNRYIYPGYQENWHTQLICDALEKVLSGEIRFLMIEAPPRHSKSIHVSQLFPAYVMGKNKDDDVIVSSYSGDLAITHGRETRNIIDSSDFQNLFDTKLSADSKAKGKWNTNGRGAYNAAGVGGSITGKGAKYFIIDDPFKDRKEADSELIRDDRFSWLRTVARTRLTPDGAIIIMHTRWHDDDMIGRIVDEEPDSEYAEPWVDYFDYLNGAPVEKWVRLTLKAIATEDEMFRKKDDPLWPQRYDLAELEDIEGSLGPYDWSALYQQQPVDDASREFKAEWFLKITWDEVEKMDTRKFATIDTALTTNKKSDFTGVTRNYVNNQNKWHVKSKRYKIDSKDIIDLIFTLHDEGFEQIGIEEGAFTNAVEPFFDDEKKKRNKFPRIIKLKHGGTAKETRIRGLIPFYSNKRIYHIVGECKDLEGEEIAFPKGKFDDCLDSLAYQTHMADMPTRKITHKQSAYETSMPYDEVKREASSETNNMPPPSSWGIKQQSYQQPNYESSLPFEVP